MKNATRRFLKAAAFPFLVLAVGLSHSYLLLRLPFLPFLGAFALPATSVIAAMLVTVLFSYIFFVIYPKKSVTTAALVWLLVAVWRFLIIGKISSDSVVLITWAVDIISLGLLPLGVLAVRRMSPNKSFKPNPLRGSA